MLNEFQDIIIGLGSTPEKILKSIYESSDDDFMELAFKLTEAVRPNPTENKPFSFIANNTLSGGRHPCSEYSCRERNLEELASFAALYADTVYIQDPFERLILTKRDRFTEVDRNELAFAIGYYGRLFPLIDKGIIKFGQSTVSLCDEHKEKIADTLNDKHLFLEKEIISKYTQIFAENCFFEIEKNPNGKLGVKITGPIEFVEHGRVHLYFNFFIPKPIKRIIKNKKLPYKMTLEESIQSRIIEQWIRPIIDDLFFLEWHSTFYGTKFLTNNENQLEIASSITDIEKFANSKSLSEGFKHTLPAILTQSTEDILRLREREPEAFYVYRDKLHKAIKTSYGWAPSEIKELFLDEVYPEINKINKKVKDWKVALRSSTTNKILFSTGIISVGLYSGVLPTNVGQIIAAIGGYTGISTLLENYSKTFKGDEEARKNDMYFLWKINK